MDEHEIFRICLILAGCITFVIADYSFVKTMILKNNKKLLEEIAKNMISNLQNDKQYFENTRKAYPKPSDKKSPIYVSDDDAYYIEQNNKQKTPPM